MIRAQKPPVRGKTTGMSQYQQNGNSGASINPPNLSILQHQNVSIPTVAFGASSIGAPSTTTSFGGGSGGSGGDVSYIGKTLIINQHHVIVEDILGQGGFSYVFLVRSLAQSSLQRYALKRMYVNNAQDLDVCKREIQILRDLSTRKNIVKYIDSSVQRILPTLTPSTMIRTDKDDDEEDDTIYEILLLTEYCSNGTLTQRMIDQRSFNGGTGYFKEKEILKIFSDICQAVSHCHFHQPKSILHRDLKIENILIDNNLSYVLCDFGSAIFIDEQPLRSNSTAFIKQLEENIQRYTTLAYRSPEMVDLYSQIPITLKSDMWALGCLLYKLMYFTLPFGDSVLAIQNGNFTIPDDMAHLYSKELNLLVRYMLETDINKRPDIYQVSYLTCKLMNMDCPIKNRFNTKLPDLQSLTMPLTESESRYQRSIASSISKTPIIEDNTPSAGTAVNPRERPKGIITQSGSLNFNQFQHQQKIAPIQPPVHRASQQESPARPILLSQPLISTSNVDSIPHPQSSIRSVLQTQQTSGTLIPTHSLSHQRSGSAVQLMFDDDFSQFISQNTPTQVLHTSSLTNIADTINTTKVSARARPSPPTTVSAATGSYYTQNLVSLSDEQNVNNLFQLPPPPSTATATVSAVSQLSLDSTSPELQFHRTHRRSQSNTVSPSLSSQSTKNYSFQMASFVEPGQSEQQQLNVFFSDRRHSTDNASLHRLQPKTTMTSEAFTDEDEEDEHFSPTKNLSKNKSSSNTSIQNVKSRESLVLEEDELTFAKKYTVNSNIRPDDEEQSISSSNSSLSSNSASSNPTQNDKKRKCEKSKRQNLSGLNEKRLSKKKKQQQHSPSNTSSPLKVLSTEEAEQKTTITNKRLMMRIIGRRSYDDQNLSSTQNENEDYENDSKRDDVQNNDIAFDQLINEDSDDDNHSKMNTIATSSFTTRLSTKSGGGSSGGQQQYEHLSCEDSTDASDNEHQLQHKSSSSSTTKLAEKVFNLFSSSTTNTNVTSTPLKDSSNSSRSSTKQTSAKAIGRVFVDAPFTSKKKQSIDLNTRKRLSINSPISHLSSSPTQNHFDTTTTTTTISFENPFLHAPFRHQNNRHRSPLSPKQQQPPSQHTVDKVEVPSVSFDPDGILMRTRRSAFAPYQKQNRDIEIDSQLEPSDIGNNTDDSSSLLYNFNAKTKLTHSESFPPDIYKQVESPTKNDVFINAPFNNKLSNKIRPLQNPKTPSSPLSTSSSNSHLIDLDQQLINIDDDGNTNMSFIDNNNSSKTFIPPLISSGDPSRFSALAKQLKTSQTTTVTSVAPPTLTSYPSSFLSNEIVGIVNNQIGSTNKVHERRVYGSAAVVTGLAQLSGLNGMQTTFNKVPLSMKQQSVDSSDSHYFSSNNNKNDSDMVATNSSSEELTSSLRRNKKKSSSTKHQQTASNIQGINQSTILPTMSSKNNSSAKNNKVNQFAFANLSFNAKDDADELL
ncbi:unnamed protein product [Didymodactylos carnosus]|uniref:non-specific serine/threonine protein kinase n=1 Tax=Didymodactylos carnosus TaxID=1234261 RepID=A0A8S2E025_9BILA|nr:unnamed protein product [Didymodactylos carnosus]CAF3839121.1 unnamed protein product [Didymodactylos carnosus]